MHKFRHFYPRQTHRAIHRGIACIEMPTTVFAEAISLAQATPDPFDCHDAKRAMGRCERHPAIELLCRWWNTNAPTPAMRCAGYVMVWEREGDCYTCSYVETPPAKFQKFMSVTASLARVGDDMLIEFWKGCESFTYDGQLGMQTWRVNGERGWTCGVAENEVRDGTFDEAWYGLDGLRRLKRRNNVSGDLSYPGAALSGFTLKD